MTEMEIEQLAINTIRFLAVDGVNKAKSGHPGAPMGMAAMAYVLWTKHQNFDPSDPRWPNRDRFVLSNGHASMLLYAMLHLSGYDLSLDDLKDFRQWGSKTPGHPEYGFTPGVEVTTGPLGQGFANAVGMAIAEQHLASTFNQAAFDVIDHFTYVFMGDGCMEEGIASEAASLAGHLELGKLIAFYDDNEISIDGNTRITFTEDVHKRFESYHWHVQEVADGNDIDALDRAITIAKSILDKPSLIICHTHIGYGSPNRQDTAKAHGSPLGDEETALTKDHLHWPRSPLFLIPDEALALFKSAAKQGVAKHDAWKKLVHSYSHQHARLAESLAETLSGALPKSWQNAFPHYVAEDGPVATRTTSGDILNLLAASVPSLIGGSADLNESTFTKLEKYPDFEPSELKGGTYSGRTINYGVREHAMAAIVNGMAVHGGVRPFGATFFTFSDYMRPAVRLSALMDIPSIFIWTHDSVGLGEDGPTHQPIEHLASLRAIPNFTVIRPADANEVVEAWRYMMTATGPVGLVLSRQKLPVLTIESDLKINCVAKGAYVISDAMSSPDVILIATGSEVSLAMEAQRKLEEIGILTRVVSMPSWELFEKQEEHYRNMILPPDCTARLSIEMGSTMGWERWVGAHGASLGIDHFGASAPYEQILKEFGFTVENVVLLATKLLKDPAAVRRLLRGGQQRFTSGHIALAPAAGSEGHS